MRKIIPLKMTEGYLRKIVHPIQEKIEEKFKVKMTKIETHRRLRRKLKEFELN